MTVFIAKVVFACLLITDILFCIANYGDPIVQNQKWYRRTNRFNFFINFMVYVAAAEQLKNGVVTILLIFNYLMQSYYNLTGLGYLRNDIARYEKKKSTYTVSETEEYAVSNHAEDQKEKRKAVIKIIVAVFGALLALSLLILSMYYEDGLSFPRRYDDV